MSTDTIKKKTKRKLYSARKEVSLTCRRLGAALPFLRRTHAVHWRHKSSPTKTTSVHLHILQIKHETNEVHSYEMRGGKEGMPCPLCNQKMFTEEGIWTHLSTTIPSQLQPTPLRGKDGTLHIALTQRTTSPSSALLLQMMPSCMVGESEVIYWRTWRSKRYLPSGRVLVPIAPGPVVDTASSQQRLVLTTLPSKLLDDNGYPLIQPETDAEAKAAAAAAAAGGDEETNEHEQQSNTQKPPYYTYDDYISLQKALAQQTDEPPARKYFHPTSLRTVTMGEWMFAADPRYAAASALRKPTPWQERAFQTKLEEFEDLDEREQEFIQNWNAAIRSRILVTDLDTAVICRKVLQQSGGNIPEKCWTVHLLNLWEERQLGREDMLILMQEYHEQRRARAALTGITTDEEDA